MHLNLHLSAGHYKLIIVSIFGNKCRLALIMIIETKGSPCEVVSVSGVFIFYLFAGVYK